MTFDQLYNLVLEQSNPIQPVNLPSPEEQAQKQQAFQQQQQKSVQDVKDVGSAAFEVAKFFDPSGILSWGDVKAAYDAFTKSTNTEDQATNGLALTLAIGSVIPIYGKATYPVKAAVKAGRTAEVAGLLGPLINKIRGVLKDTNLLRTHGIDAKQLDNAFQTVNRNRNKINVPYRDTRTGQIIDPRTDPQVYRQQPQRTETSYGRVENVRETEQQKLNREMEQARIERNPNAPKSADINKFTGNIVNGKKTYFGKFVDGQQTAFHDLIERRIKFIDNATKGRNLNKDIQEGRLKLIDKTIVPQYGERGIQHREVVALSVDDDYILVMYTSSGTGGGKALDEWQTIPGFATIPRNWTRRKGEPPKEGFVDKYFIKNQETVDMTRGGNQYMTQLARFLKQNGTSALTISPY